MSKTVIGLYESPQDARAALDALEHSDSRFDRVLVLRGAELAERLRSAAPGDDAEELWRGARQLFQEYDGAPTGARPIHSDDGVLMVVVPNEWADSTAAFLDEHGAIDLDTRTGRLTETGDAEVHRATGLNPHHGGRIPPGMREDEAGGNEPMPRERRADAEHRARQTCARIFNC